MPTPQDMTAVVHSYVRAFDEGDPAMAAALFADDATIEDPIGTPIKRGKDAIRQFYEAGMASGAKLVLQGPIRIGGDYAAFAFQVQLQMSGKRASVDVIDIFRFSEAGKIIEMRAFWGPANMTGL